MSYAPIHEKTWADVEREIFSPEEIEESHVRVALMKELIKARQERGISQRDLEEMTGVKQSEIARIETGATEPKFDTVMKVLLALGKTLAIVDFTPEAAPSQEQAREARRSR